MDLDAKQAEEVHTQYHSVLLTWCLSGKMFAFTSQIHDLPSTKHDDGCSIIFFSWGLPQMDQWSGIQSEREYSRDVEDVCYVFVCKDTCGIVGHEDNILQPCESHCSTGPVILSVNDTREIGRCANL